MGNTVAHLLKLVGVSGAHCAAGSNGVVEAPAAMGRQGVRRAVVGAERATTGPGLAQTRVGLHGRGVRR